MFDIVFYPTINLAAFASRLPQIFSEYDYIDINFTILCYYTMLIHLQTTLCYTFVILTWLSRRSSAKTCFTQHYLLFTTDQGYSTLFWLSVPVRLPFTLKITLHYLATLHYSERLGIVWTLFWLLFPTLAIWNCWNLILAADLDSYQDSILLKHRERSLLYTVDTCYSFVLTWCYKHLSEKLLYILWDITPRHYTLRHYSATLLWDITPRHSAELLLNSLIWNITLNIVHYI